MAGQVSSAAWTTRCNAPEPPCLARLATAAALQIAGACAVHDGAVSGQDMAWPPCGRLAVE